MKRKVTLILLVIFFTGLSVLLYPSISQYINSKRESKAIADYESITSRMSPEKIKKILEEATNYNQKLYDLDSPLLEYDKINGYYDILDINNNGMMGYLSIDKLKVELPIYHGTSTGVLNSAVGHIKGSSLPVGGKNVHSVVSAHRGLPSAKLFTDLDKLEKGDVFTVTIINQVITYEVDQVKVVKPDDIRDINIIEDKDYMTLLTCTPYGINSHRLLVRGKRIENISKERYVNAEAYLIDRLIVTSFIALPILLILIMYTIFKPVNVRKEEIYEV